MLNLCIIGKATAYLIAEYNNRYRNNRCDNQF